jgi:hypothetical protein
MFFVSPKRGPRSQPKKSAAREMIVHLRKQNYSVYEISEALKEADRPLSATAVREVLKEEGLAPLLRRLDEEAREVFRFVEFWKQTHGVLPRQLVFDSQLTTQEGLAELDGMGISFLTLRRRSPNILKEIVLLPRSAWRTVELDIPTRKYRTPRVYEQVVRLRDHEFRQLYILDLGHEEPTVLLTNELRTSSKNLISRYAQRMLIENALSDAVRFFHLDALSSSVGMKVDFDMALLVVASGLYRLLARRMRGYGDAQARHLFRDIIDIPADVRIVEKEVQVRFHRRSHLPIILASGLMDQPVAVPWWNEFSLRLSPLKPPLLNRMVVRGNPG